MSVESFDCARCVPVELQSVEPGRDAHGQMRMSFNRCQMVTIREMIGARSCQRAPDGFNRRDA